MKKYWRLIQALLMVVTLSGCTNGCNNANANPLGSNPVGNPTLVPTATPVTSTARTMYLKIKAGTPSTTSTFNVQVWVIDGVGTTYLHNGPVTLDSTNSYEWSSTVSNPYPAAGATFYFSLTAPSNQGLTNEVHKVISAVDSIYYTGVPPASMPDGGSFSF